MYKNPVFLFELKGGAMLFYGIPKQRVPCEFPLSEIYDMAILASFHLKQIDMLIIDYTRNAK